MFCANDLRAWQLAEICRTIGLKVPKDVAILGAEIIATTDAFGDKVEIKGGLGTPHEWDKPWANEFILSRACLKESVAREEVTRFKNWLVSIRERSRYNLDGLE